MEKGIDSTLSLRPSTMNDADLLLEWRNDITTREASLTTAFVEMQSHCIWLQATLDNPQRRLYIAEYQHQSVGTIRADMDGKGWLLSWTVAPLFRGQGIAHKILNTFIEGYDCPLFAHIKVTNIASIKVAERADFRLLKKSAGVLFYQKN